jgi:polyhydroxybutyrate depolymerase
MNRRLACLVREDGGSSREAPMLRTWLTAALLAAIPRALSAAEPTEPGSHALVFRHAGEDRKYRLYVPRGYDPRKAVPLVFAFHGGGPQGSAATAEKGLGFNPLADRHGFLVCYPEGVEHHWNDGRESPRFPKKPQDDVDFVAKLLDHLRANYKIDPDRVFATGNSNGGFFSHRLGWELSDRLAAIAPSAGTLGTTVVGKFAPKHPVHVLHIHGTDDPAVPYNGGTVIGNGGECVAVPDLIGRWVKANGCAAEPKVEVLPKKTADPTKVRKEVYAAGGKKSEVVLLAVEGHGHNWPGRPAPGEKAGPSTKELNAAEVVWDFFREHPKVRP